MKIATTRFGEYELSEEAVIHFSLGLLGFPACRRYAIIPHPGGGPCQWLQSCDVPEVAFVVCEPQIFVPDYRVSIKLEEMAPIEAQTLEEARVWSILRVPTPPEKPTLNLVGPLLVNPVKRLGMQYVLNSGGWSHRHEIG